MRHCSRLVILLAAILPLLAGSGARAEMFPARDGNGDAPVVRVYSSLDANISQPLVAAFQDMHPGIAVEYSELQTLDIYERVISESDRGEGTADLALSSAMDLQMKLANDGYARRVATDGAQELPRWANWRDTAFGLTWEPAVMVYHKPSFGPAGPPNTRGELLTMLQERSDEMFGRIATYDIERAGVGMLFLARDIEHYRDVWGLVDAMGVAGVKLYSTSSAILERVSDGRFALGYNILGSYAAGWQRNHPDLGIVLPRDYCVVMSRVALVPAKARSPELGRLFLEFLLSREGQETLARESGIPAIHPEVGGRPQSLEPGEGVQLRPVPLSPALLVYLDQVKRARLTRRWNDALKPQ
jgi:iron(III) transport system substrate-binding protein